MALTHMWRPWPEGDTVTRKPRIRMTALIVFAGAIVLGCAKNESKKEAADARGSASPKKDSDDVPPPLKTGDKSAPVKDGEACNVPDATKTAAALPADVVAAWEKAGAKPGWMGVQREHSNFVFFSAHQR